jgi:hypothetical protein
MGLIRKGLDIDFDSGKVSINSELEFLNLEKNEYYNKTINLNIPIITEIENVENIKTGIELLAKKRFIGNKVLDMPAGEIVSATKLSVYTQCHLKYYLTYDLGFAQIFGLYKKWQVKKGIFARYEFNESEDEKLAGADATEIRNIISESADIKGRVIHKLLQKEVPTEQFEDSINNILKVEIDPFETEQNVINSLKTEIISELNKYYNSEVYKEISNFRDYRNEYEVYAKENNYFLYGIIDKLIFKEDRVLIVDYKTDILEGKNIGEKINSYYTQLSFYSYIAGRLFSKTNKFEIQLIFIRYPDQIYKKEIGRPDFEKISDEISNMVSNTREQIINKNLNHCNFCSYSTDHKHCIII